MEPKSLNYPILFYYSCLNPVIYGFMSKNFRKSFLYNIRSCCKCKNSKCSQPKSTPTKNTIISGYSRKYRNHSVASLATTNTQAVYRTQETNLVSTTNNKKDAIELS